jgi:quercetin dioxygenase-like cupin family protein
MRRLLLLGVALCFTAAAAIAQDPVKVDPKHYKLVSENAQVRILKFHYGPHEKSVMHSHPNLVAIFFVDGRAKFTMADGTSQERAMKAGDSMWMEAETHLPENLGDTPIEGVLVEMKGKAPAHPMTKARPKK